MVTMSCSPPALSGLPALLGVCACSLIEGMGTPVLGATPLDLFPPLLLHHLLLLLHPLPLLLH